MIPLHHFTFWQDEGVYVPFRGGEKRTSVGTERVTTKKTPRRLKTNQQMKVEKDGVKRSGGKSEWKVSLNKVAPRTLQQLGPDLGCELHGALSLQPGAGRLQRRLNECK